MSTNAESQAAQSSSAGTSQDISDREIFAEGRRNAERWQRDAESIREQYPTHWITIYNGGETVVGHEHAREHFRHIFTLTGLNRSAAFSWPPPRDPNVRYAPTVRRKSAT